MLHFESDYIQGAHPEVLKRLIETNMDATSGYGTDEYCRMAAEKIKAACACPEAEVYFLVGGTQTNATVIDGILRQWQGVMSADTGHIACHESGAVEACGHKVITLPNHNGKLRADDVEAYLINYYADESREHIVEPGMVYISFPTESGTIYSQAELDALHDVCVRYNIPLFVDGARLGYGLMAEGCDVTLQSLAHSCEVFYIGGTKVGTLFGEALVVTKPGVVSHFVSVMKRRGALLAKGRLLGVQFDALFTDGLYYRISENAIRTASELKRILREKGYEFYFDSPTNQVFVLLTDEQYNKLSENVVMSYWAKPDEEHTAARLCTSWATTMEEIAVLEKYL